MPYLKWNETTITDFSENNISEMYNRGYVFTRIGKGVMHQTRSVRIDLSKFELSSENRRILKKIEGVTNKKKDLPMTEYDFKIGKLAKDFYEVKFGPGIMSAQKVKEMLVDQAKSNFNTVLEFNRDDSYLGFSICYQSNNLLHYSYPFYDLNAAPKDMGLGMMALAIEYAKNAGLKYIYLGSLQRPTDTYKLQFKGLEWFDGSTWSTDLDKVRKILAGSQ
ncbi:MAG: hypothetical protein KBC33_03310 [Candidatus Pacebacteria bacterium]|nr:hypothetical protein [Candidatus Paceibacterota bacterium]